MTPHAAAILLLTGAVVLAPARLPAASAFGEVVFDPPGGAFRVKSRRDIALTFTVGKALETGSRIGIIVPIGGWSRPSFDPRSEGMSKPGGPMVHVSFESLGGGRFRVTSEPGKARLWLNNVREGDTPLEIGPLSPGGHQFKAAAKGKKTWQARLRYEPKANRLINVTAYQYSKVEFQLTKKTDPDARLQPEIVRYTDRGPPYTDRDPARHVVFTLTSGRLSPDDELRIRFPNMRVGAWALLPEPSRNKAGFRVRVKPAGAKTWEDVDGCPDYTLLPGPPRALKVRAPSRVVAGEPFSISILARDSQGNPARDFRGDVAVQCSDPRAEIPGTITFGEEDGGVKRLEGLRLRTPGVVALSLTGPDTLKVRKVATSPIEVLAEAPDLRLFWGELHSHGYFSFDARNWGGCVLRPADMYWYARNVENLDFAAVTDHAVHSGKKCGHRNITEPEFLEIQRAAAAWNEDGEFVSFSAVEQRCARGDTNVFFLRDDEAYYMRDRVLSIAELWRFYRGRPVISIPHLHPAIRRKERFDQIDPTIERLVEVFSNHGRYEFNGNQPFLPGKGMVVGNDVQSILARGHRLGIVAASDDHSGRPGITALTGVYAQKHTRESIFEAIRARHTYGTTGARINLQFHLGEKMMGDEIAVPAASPLQSSRRFRVRVAGTETLQVVEIVRNGTSIYSVQPRTRVAEFTYEDREPLTETQLGSEKGNPPTTYYYLRVFQQNMDAKGRKIGRGGMAWSSPIFLSPEG